VFSGISIAWALAPDTAWTEANHTALAFLALVLGITLGSIIPHAPERFAMGLALATAPVIAWALLARCLPTVFGSDYEPSRLQAPIGYWNALALVAVIAVPGILWWAGRRGATTTDLLVSSGGLAVVFTALMLTYSRGGLLALILVLVIVLWMVPGRVRMLSVLIGGAIGALLPVIYGLTTDALTDDALIAADRSDAGLGLLWRITLGVALALLVGWLALRLLGGGRLTRRRAGVAVMGGGGTASPTASPLPPSAAHGSIMERRTSSRRFSDSICKHQELTSERTARSRETRDEGIWLGETKLSRRWDSRPRCVAHVG
jgi:predicted membrane protein